MNEPSNADRERIHAELLARRKIEAIKIYREATGAGLKDAKDAVERMEEELQPGTRPTQNAGGKGKGGCMPILLLVFTLAAAVWFAW